jgi:hypothetical protein
MEELIAVSDLNTLPYPSIAWLETKRKKFLFKNAYFHGSGVVINRRYILTAGHNLHSTRGISSFVSAKISLGYNLGSSLLQLDKLYPTSSTNVAQGLTFNNFKIDFAMIELGREVPESHNYRC